MTIELYQNRDRYKAYKRRRILLKAGYKAEVFRVLYPIGHWALCVGS